MPNSPDPDPSPDPTNPHDMQAVLCWCATRGVTFGVTVNNSLLMVTARCDNIYAEYEVAPPYDAKSLGDAVWAATYAVKHGTEFHEKHGQFPMQGE